MGKLLFLLIAILVCDMEMSFSAQRRYHRKPKYFSKHLNRNIQKKIVMYHNYFRSHVDPPAANMLRMSWHKGAARRAQRWADQCKYLKHDTITERWDDDFGPCGQNIYVSSRRDPWWKAMKAWFAERHNFTYGWSRNDLKTVGHYTQMVWALTHRVGCGIAFCYRDNATGHRRMFFNYVCNYCPTGNVKGNLGRPYKKGPTCSACPKQCPLNRGCMNSCPMADLWSNCREIHATWPEWLCGADNVTLTFSNNVHDEETAEAFNRRKHCRATCTCGDNKLY